MCLASHSPRLKKEDHIATVAGRCDAGLPPMENPWIWFGVRMDGWYDTRLLAVLCCIVLFLCSASHFRNVAVFLLGVIILFNSVCAHVHGTFYSLTFYSSVRCPISLHIYSLFSLFFSLFLFYHIHNKQNNETLQQRSLRFDVLMLILIVCTWAEEGREREKKAITTTVSYKIMGWIYTRKGLFRFIFKNSDSFKFRFIQILILMTSVSIIRLSFIHTFIERTHHPFTYSPSCCHFSFHGLSQSPELKTGIIAMAAAAGQCTKNAVTSVAAMPWFDRPMWINELHTNFEVSSFLPSLFGIQFEIKKRNQGKRENEYGSQWIIFPLDHKFKCRVESSRVEWQQSWWCCCYFDLAGPLTISKRNDAKEAQCSIPASISRSCSTDRQAGRHQWVIQFCLFQVLFVRNRNVVARNEVATTVATTTASPPPLVGC